MCRPSKYPVIDCRAVGGAQRVADIGVALDCMDQPDGIVEHLPEQSADVLIGLGRVLAQRGIELGIGQQHVAYIVGIRAVSRDPVELAGEIDRAIIALMLFMCVAAARISRHGHHHALGHHVGHETLGQGHLRAVERWEFAGFLERFLRIERRDESAQCQHDSRKDEEERSHWSGSPSKLFPDISTRGAPW